MSATDWNSYTTKGTSCEFSELIVLYSLIVVYLKNELFERHEAACKNRVFHKIVGFGDQNCMGAVILSQYNVKMSFE